MKINTGRFSSHGCIMLIFYVIMCVSGGDVSAGEYQTSSGKSLIIEESHPLGQSLSDIHLRSSGFEFELNENIINSDPIQSVHVADLDGNGFDEFYIVTVSSGSGSYGNIVAFASNKDKSLSSIHFPEIKGDEEIFHGYMGHDTFRLSAHRLIRTFPIYESGDKNAAPNGGLRNVLYGLVKGEASWQLRIIDTGDET